MKMAAIYARVSSEQQREEHTIASQTAALIEFAKSHDLEVPKEWVFEDEGFSGATLERPGLERVRDLAAEGQIQVVLAYAPDRLSRKYAYQVLLIEEFARHGVETLFVKAPQSASAEDQLLVQFQGMIAEYERAQILERSRRGKRHRARSGEVSVLSGAPYGYRYIRKTDEAPASYAVIDAEARVVQRVYEMYTVEGLSIGEIARRLNAEGIPTRKQSARWERSVVWAMLRNPAYRGAACFGKTRVAGRIRVTRALRRRGGIVSSNSGGHERAREDWIEIPVPALVSEESFARAQELLHENKIRSRRRTITPSIVQGLVSCQKCGYAFSRTSTYTTARKIHYYKCIGSDGWRKLGGPVCDNRMVRQDLLDQIVWTEVIRLLEDPTLIQQELDRRLGEAAIEFLLDQGRVLKQSDNLGPDDLIEQILPHEAFVIAYRTAQFSPAVRTDAFVVVDFSRGGVSRGAGEGITALLAADQSLHDTWRDRAASRPYLVLVEQFLSSREALLAHQRGHRDLDPLLARTLVADTVAGDGATAPTQCPRDANAGSSPGLTESRLCRDKPDCAASPTRLSAPSGRFACGWGCLRR